MTTAQLKQIATGSAAVATKEAKPKDIAHLLASPGVQSQIKAALPRHMTAERMARIATTEMRKVPKLGQCDPMSFLGAVIQCAQLGLEPGNALGHAYILPFDKREKVGGQWKTTRTEAQVIIGYRGMIDLARRSGQIVSIDARAVYEGDKFECKLGLDPVIEHTPDWQNPNRADPSKLRFVYAVAKLKDGGVQFDVMSRAEVESIRARSKAADAGPWVTDFASMATKTVVRRLFKFLPVSIEMQRAIGLDEMAEDGISQQTASVIDGDFVVVDEPEIEGEEPKKLENAALLAEYMAALDKASSSETASLMLDEARDTLSAEDYAKLAAAFEAKFGK
jgi:recombination protein RecT